MANEFKHKDPCTTLTQCEYIGADGTGHVFASQATGDLLYADSSTVLNRLARACSGSQMLQIASCKPAWTATPSLGTTSWCNMNHAHGAGNSGGTVCANVLAGTTLKCSVVTSSLTTVAALNAGSITSGFGTIDNGSSDITTTGLISGGSLDIDNVLINGTTIGHTCDTDLMTVGNASLTIKGDVTVGVDGTGHDVKFFGDTAGAFMLYDQSCDQLEIRGASADATTSTGKLLLSTSLANVNANDVIGSISFQAPLECGTDAVKVSASITAVAQGTFAANVNATDIIFYTAHDNCVAERFRFTSQGEIGIAGANYGSDGQVLTSTGGGTAVAWEDAGGCFDGTLDADLSFTGTQKIISTSNGSISIIPHGTGAIGIGSCAGVNAAIRINPAAFTATACAVAYRTSFDGANAMTVPSGTSAIAATINVGEPNITATGTVTTGTTVRIAGPPTEGTNNYSLLVCSGAVRFVGQPMVTAFNSATDCNATGAGTEAAVDFNTETFDQGCNFASDAFTAPQTGRYLVASHVRMQGITSGMNRGLLYFKSSNRNYVYAANHLGNIRACGNEIGMQGTAIVDMDKCDTLSVSAYAFGGSDVADISGTSYPITWVSIGMIA